MSRGPKIPKIKFLAVVADIQNHPSTHFATIAGRHRISASSVSNINAARTWGNYLAHKKATLSVRNHVKAQSKKDLAVKAGLNPRTADDRLKAHDLAVREKHLDQEETKLAAELEKLEATPTRTEFKNLEGAVHERLDIQHRLIKHKADKGDISNLQFAFNFLFFAAIIVLAVVK